MPPVRGPLITNLYILSLIYISTNAFVLRRQDQTRRKQTAFRWHWRCATQSLLQARAGICPLSCCVFGVGCPQVFIRMLYQMGLDQTRLRCTAPHRAMPHYGHLSSFQVSICQSPGLNPRATADLGLRTFFEVSKLQRLGLFLQTGVSNSAPTLKCPQKSRSKGIWRQGIVLKHRNSLQKSLCPVVICPCLCSPEFRFPKLEISIQARSLLQ